MDNSGQFEFLDILTIMSFVLQIQNQSNIIGLSDVQTEVNRAVSEIHAHLEEQDRMLKLLLSGKEGKHETEQVPVRKD